MKTITVDPYDIDIRVHVLSAAKAKEKWANGAILFDDSSAVTMVGNGIDLVLLHDAGVGVKEVAHECFHIVKTIADNRGFPVGTDDTDEPCAYLLGWLADKVWCILQKELDKE